MCLLEGKIYYKVFYILLFFFTRRQKKDLTSIQLLENIIDIIHEEMLVYNLFTISGS